MLTDQGWRTGARRVAGRIAASLVSSICLLALPQATWANGVGENGAWQFQTSQDRVNKGAVLDLIERKKGGYYDSFQTTNYNTSNTYIDKQFNCALNASSSGNGGTNSMGASTSSPTVSNTGTTSASTDANSATNGVWQPGYPGVMVAGGYPGQSGGAVGNNQSNTGRLESGVSGSSTSANTGEIAAGGGYSTQALNSSQNNTGAQTATVSGSTACNGPLVGQ